MSKVKKVSKVELFKEDSLVYLKNASTNYLMIDSIKHGRYNLIYMLSDLNVKDSILFNVQKGANLAIDLCTKTIKYQSRSPYIYKLKSGDSLIIESKLEGCFKRDSIKTLVVKKNNDAYFGTYNRNTKRLTHHDLHYIKLFEKQLPLYYYTGCTTEIKYKLLYKNEVFEIIDGTCSWNGFQILIDKLDFRK